MNINKLISISIVLLSSCAQIVAPTGGKKDETPPVIISENPENKSINFKSNQINIKFDEYVNVTNLDQIIISPPLETKPVIEPDGKEVIVKFKSDLNKNTTYTINFANSIVDVNEGNALQNYAYVFSTGNTIDSNYVTGEIVNSFNKKPEKDFNVCLYKVVNFNDTTLQKRLPDYFAKTNEAGIFTIKNLPEDTFYLYAFKDENKNLKFDIGEDVAFVNYTINTAQTSDSLQLLSIKTSQFEPGYVKDTSYIANGIYGFYTYKPAFLLFEPTDKSLTYSKIIKGKDNFDSVYYYVPNQLAENAFEVKMSQILQPDSAKIITLKSRKALKYKALEIKTSYPDKPNDSITITFNNPVIFTDEQLKGFGIMQDSIEVPKKFIKQLDPFTVKLYTAWEEDLSYEIIADDSLFKDIFNQYNRKVKTNFRAPNSKDFGSIKFNLTNAKNRNLIVELVTADDTEQLINSYSINKTTTIEIPFVSPMSLKIKVIVDENNNGQWDGGDFKSRKQPEQIFYHPESFSIKAMWDLEQTINLDQNGL